LRRGVKLQKFLLYGGVLKLVLKNPEKEKEKERAVRTTGGGEGREKEGTTRFGVLW